MPGDEADARSRSRHCRSRLPPAACAGHPRVHLGAPRRGSQACQSRAQLAMRWGLTARASAAPGVPEQALSRPGPLSCIGCMCCRPPAHAWLQHARQGRPRGRASPTGTTLGTATAGTAAAAGTGTGATAGTGNPAGPGMLAGTAAGATSSASVTSVFFCTRTLGPTGGVRCARGAHPTSAAAGPGVSAPDRRWAPSCWQMAAAPSMPGACIHMFDCVPPACALCCRPFSARWST